MLRKQNPDHNSPVLTKSAKVHSKVPAKLQRLHEELQEQMYRKQINVDLYRPLQFFVSEIFQVVDQLKKIKQTKVGTVKIKPTGNNNDKKEEKINVPGHKKTEELVEKTVPLESIPMDILLMKLHNVNLNVPLKTFLMRLDAHDFDIPLEEISDEKVTKSYKKTSPTISTISITIENKLFPSDKDAIKNFEELIKKYSEDDENKIKDMISRYKRGNDILEKWVNDKSLPILNLIIHFPFVALRAELKRYLELSETLALFRPTFQTFQADKKSLISFLELLKKHAKKLDDNLSDEINEQVNFLDRKDGFRFEALEVSQTRKQWIEQQKDFQELVAELNATINIYETQKRRISPSSITEDTKESTAPLKESAEIKKNIDDLYQKIDQFRYKNIENQTYKELVGYIESQEKALKDEIRAARTNALREKINPARDNMEEREESKQNTDEKVSPTEYLSDNEDRAERTMVRAANATPIDDSQSFAVVYLEYRENLQKRQNVEPFLQEASLLDTLITQLKNSTDEVNYHLWQVTLAGILTKFPDAFKVIHSSEFSRELMEKTKNLLPNREVKVAPSLFHLFADTLSTSPSQIRLLGSMYDKLNDPDLLKENKFDPQLIKALQEIVHKKIQEITEDESHQTLDASAQREQSEHLFTRDLFFDFGEMEVRAGENIERERVLIPFSRLRLDQRAKVRADLYSEYKKLSDTEGWNFLEAVYDLGEKKGNAVTNADFADIMRRFVTPPAPEMLNLSVETMHALQEAYTQGQLSFNSQVLRTTCEDILMLMKGQESYKKVQPRAREYYLSVLVPERQLFLPTIQDGIKLIKEFKAKTKQNIFDETSKKLDDILKRVQSEPMKNLQPEITIAVKTLRSLTIQAYNQLNKIQDDNPLFKIYKGYTEKFRQVANRAESIIKEQNQNRLNESAELEYQKNQLDKAKTFLNELTVKIDMISNASKKTYTEHFQQLMADHKETFKNEIAKLDDLTELPSHESPTIIDEAIKKLILKVWIESKKIRSFDENNNAETATTQKAKDLAKTSKQHTQEAKETLYKAYQDLIKKLCQTVHITNMQEFLEKMGYQHQHDQKHSISATTMTLFHGGGGSAAFLPGTTTQKAETKLPTITVSRPSTSNSVKGKIPDQSHSTSTRLPSIKQQATHPKQSLQPTSQTPTRDPSPKRSNQSTPSVYTPTFTNARSVSLDITTVKESKEPGKPSSNWSSLPSTPKLPRK